MIIKVESLANCDHCKGHPVIERVGPEGAHQYFVMCKNPEGCGTPEGRGCRPLTNGCTSQHKAETAWAEEAERRRQREALAGGGR